MNKKPLSPSWKRKERKKIKVEGKGNLEEGERRREASSTPLSRCANKTREGRISFPNALQGESCIPPFRSFRGVESRLSEGRASAPGGETAALTGARMEMGADHHGLLLRLFVLAYFMS